MSRPAAQDNTKQSPSPADDGDTPFKVQKPATTFVDVTDLLFYLRNHTTLTGIQTSSMRNRAPSARTRRRESVQVRHA